MAFDFGNANEAQRSAISTIDGPLLIIAGPGTGKTYTLVKRIVYLITEKDVLPEEIMIATFTEKAAKELITRITNELYAIGVFVNLNEMYIGTFHSICLRILKDHLEYTRIKKNYRMLDNFEQQYMVFQKINRFRNLPCFDVIFDKKQGAWRQAGEIVKYVNNLAEELVDIDEMQGDADEHIVAVANIMKQYNTLMEDENLIDFSSIQTEAYKLLIEKPSILEEIQQKIKYVMVDEYQDTNYIQELLVFLIAGKNKNICVVGDDDQGLYRFRGATIRNILEFPGHFAEGECKQVKLVTNYRSERQIIDFYNKWMSTTDGRAYDFMWKNFRFEKKIVPPEGKKDAKVGVIKCSGRDLLDDWYEQVYSFITQLKSSGVLTDYNQIAVLCKSVKGDKIIGMVEYLEEHGIKVYSPRSEMFFERKEIKQVIGCMILCFPEYVRKLQQRDFSYDFENLYKYYDTQCIAAARKLILQYRDTLGKELIIDALGIQKFDSSTVYDGELDGWMVKIMPTNRIATKADLEELKANLPYHTFEKRKEENPNGVVEKIKIICMGHEADLKASLEQELSSYNLEIEIVDILRDKKDLQFKREADANVVKENNQIIIKEFYPMNLLQKLSMQKESVEDWRQLVESIYIDWNYDGQTMRPTIRDIPAKDELVSGIYKIPASVGKIKIKITDLLSESLELEV